MLYPGLKKWRDEITVVSVSALLVLVLAIVIQVVFLVDYRENEMDAARARMKSTVETLETQMRAMLRDVDLGYRVLESQLHPGDLDVLPGQGNPNINEQIRNLKLALPEISVVGITNAAGNYIYHSDEVVPGHVSLADRDYFKLQRSGLAENHTTIEFLFGKTSKVWTIIISRRLTLPDGSFAGVMVSGLNLDILQRFIEGLSMPHGSVMSIRDIPNRVVVHHPKDVVARGTVVRAALFEDSLYRGERAGFGLGQTAFGRSPSIGAFVAPADVPFRFMAAIPEAVVLARWHRTLLLALLGTALLAIAFFAILRESHVSRVREKIIREQEGRLRLAASVFDHAAEGIMITDSSGNIVSANSAAEKITGYSVAELMGRPPSVLNSNLQDPERCNTVRGVLASGRSWVGDIWNMRKDGEVYAQYTSITPVLGENSEITHFVNLIMDVTEIRRTQDQLSRMAFHDALTDLPNRRMFAEHLDAAIRAAPLRKERLIVGYLDLDGFKLVNDRHGHAAGDTLLCVIAKRITGALRTGDTLARLGGDEFVFFAWAGDTTLLGDIEMLVNRVLDVIAKPCELSRDGAAHVTASVSGSIGIAIFPEHGETAEILMRHADHAMYEAKQSGKNQFKIFAV